MRIAVGMSGGVDSSTVISLLRDQGHEVVGVTMKLYKDGYTYAKSCYSPENATNIEVCRRQCESLGIPYHVIDVSDEFQEYVLNYIRDSYKSGNTPNPCIRCNSNIKFGFFIKKIHELGLNIDKFATGHYANIVEHDGFYYLKSNDSTKDQVYFLYRIQQEVLAKTLFPLGGMTKDETRALARSYGLEVADKKESQDFGNISEIVSSTPGDIIYDGRTVGQHKGITNYTVGQRKGLETTLNIPVFVKQIDVLNNRLVVTDEDALYRNSCKLEDFFMLPHSWISGNLKAKIRSTHASVAVIVADDEIHFKQPVRDVTPGQSLVLYKDGYVVGGGIIKA